MRTLFADVETYSSIDLAKCGVYAYCGSPDFEVMLFGYSADDGEVKVVDLMAGEELPPEVLSALTDDSVTKWAHNAAVERVCLSQHLGLPEGHLDPSSWRCSMIWSAYMGLPHSLEGAGAVLGLDKQKLAEGKELVRYFCRPCRATKASGGRTRNLPADAPERWDAFKAYNARDVEAEMEIAARLARFPVPDDEWDSYILDQKINDRGVALDMVLVENAIAADEISRSEIAHRMREITSLENPNSVQQMRRWLADNGLETDSLDKKAVAGLLKTAPGPLREVLTLRRQLAKSSVKKYTAMKNAVCSDGRARGMFRFYGASRTGRWAGRILQPQNLPANHLPDIEAARGIVRNGDTDALGMLYDSVPDVLSELIRTAFVPRDGCKLIVADFSAIEARVIAWIAGEEWKMGVFAADGKVYEATASRMFGVPAESITKESPLRQKGKIAELACIAEGELVLTDKGLVPIESVGTDHLVWDGVSWVRHGGVIYRGTKEVIEYEGLKATADHLVWICGQPQPIRFGVAAASGAHLVQTGDGREAVRLGGDNRPGKTLEREMEPLLRADTMYGLRECAVAEPEQFAHGEIAWLPDVLTPAKSATVARQEAYRREAEMRKPKRRRLPELRRKGDRVEVRFGLGSGALDHGAFPGAFPRFGDRPDRHERPLRTRKHQACDARGKPEQQAEHRAVKVGAAILAILPKRGGKKTIRGPEPQGDHKGRRDGRVREKEELASDLRAVRVYDIRDAGEHHRFTVSGKLVHNCGYGGSVGALKAMGALEMGLAEEELKPLVDAWRAANSNIVRLWWEVDRAAKAAVKGRTKAATHGIRFEYASGMLFITLPSGRRLSYVKPRIGTNRFGGECVTYEGMGTAKRWERIESYGPKFVENTVQAISRDLLACAMRGLDRAGHRIVMHCHDEVVIEAEPDASVNEVISIMCAAPEWAKGLDLRAEGYECAFYQKS
jgi:DNA polymerase